ncbi:phenylacetate--CoA ligase family protein [Craterilacuibacter sinensis]|uniref:AMP-binding protein n=1 Tax=Craterilacuibacter sinensis TaxID=2686017 RepID=A0A845BM26_9NEIS|nr:AMP-binding protein [Craterilacuibacter sinensis]MXR37395.1 AMP-binding protein [Craterilacuibacter sinensis]
MNHWPCDPAALLLARLPAQLSYAREQAPAYTALLSGLPLDAINNRAALASLPLTRKSALIAAQAARPPFGGYAAGKALRVFASPGPIYEPMDAASYRMDEALTAAGFVADDIVHNGFSYHLSPGGFIFDSALQALGCTVFPGGPGNLEITLAALANLGVNAYVGTPSFLQLILDKADETATPLALAKALVSGEALSDSLRVRCRARGIAICQCYASAELGLIAYETDTGTGMHVAGGIIAEICDASGKPLPEGETGELVITSFSPVYPLIRFATGDLSAFVPGSQQQRIKGWLGRADDTAKVRGLFVHPEQVKAVLARHNDIHRARLILSHDDAGKDVMTLHIDAAASCDTAAIESSLKALTRLSGRVLLSNALPDDGRLIEDRR